MKNAVETSYQTADLGLATFLLTIGHELIGATLVAPNRLVFSFKNTDKIEQEVLGYISGTGQAPAKKLFETYRSLRALTFERTGNLHKQGRYE